LARINRRALGASRDQRGASPAKAKCGFCGNNRKKKEDRQEKHSGREARVDGENSPKHSGQTNARRGTSETEQRRNVGR
jgi:hypothetical protein